MRFSLVFFLLAGCPAKDTADDTSATGSTDTQETALPLDADGDGFAEDADCDDGDPAVHPGATEVCDGLDNDCDGEVDADATDATAWFADGDEDGFGLDSDPVWACEAPSGHVALEGDCDDDNNAVYPGAEESDCTDPVDYNCDGSVGFADGDGDGLPACEDCDDDDAALSVSTPETCDGVDNDCDGVVDNDASDATVWYGDADGDGYGGTQFTAEGCENPGGYVTNADDCNDVHAASHPGAAEVCDSADNDCDGDVDEGVLVTWYADADGDGFGDAAGTQDACNQPPGHASNGDDCDDANPQASPAATEVCDGIDNDCDGTADDGGVDATTWFADGDSDGHGDAGTSVEACSAPTGHVATDDDCNDADGAISPSAPEVCDSVDNDCDGDTDEDDATDAITWYGDLDGDGYGGTVLTSTSCAQPTGYTSSSDDCDDLESFSYPGAPELCDLRDNDCDGAVDEEEDLQGGSGSAWYADSDGDGYGDANVPDVACSQPSGYVANTSDCDDTNGAVSPGATEVCNGVDDDCNGETDDGDSGVDLATATTWYQDGDQDGYGDGNVSSVACSAPSGFVTDSTDCDDARGSVNPGASEACDGLDTDCNGTVDDDSVLLGGAAECAASSCLDVLGARPAAADGTYFIDPNAGATTDAFSVTCDMTGGGYTVLKLYGGRTSMNSYSDCSDYSGYGTNHYLGGNHSSSCGGSQVDVTWHDANDGAIPADQVTAMNAAGMTSRETPNWVRDADGNTHDVYFCMDTTLVNQWAWAPKSQGNDNSCFLTTNGAMTPVFNKWSASTGAQDSGQNWMLERDWHFRE